MTIQDIATFLDGYRVHYEMIEESVILAWPNKHRKYYDTFKVTEFGDAVINGRVGDIADYIDVIFRCN